MLNIIVCIKQIPDPEAPTSSYHVDNETNRIVQKGVPPVISPFDENALEAALRIKDMHQVKITVISMGHNLSKAVLSRSLAAGAEELIFLDDNLFDHLDSTSTARILSAAIKKIRDYDVIFTGIQSADWNAGIVGSGIAELLSIPCITIVRKAELVDNMMRAERVLQDGYQVIQTPLPAVFTISNELGALRSFALRDMMEAQKKPIVKWNASDIRVDPSHLAQLNLLRMYIPQKESRCEFVQGNTDEESGEKLAIKLRENNLI